MKVVCDDIINNRSVRNALAEDCVLSNLLDLAKFL